MNILATDRQSSDVEEHNTTCAYCGVGCGVVATVENDKIVSVRGNEKHPANQGRLCVKGSSLHETLGDKSRILEPRIAGKEVSWQEATQKVAHTFSQLIKDHGPGSVAFYLSGQLLTEDYYIANKLMKGFMGSGNVDTNSRLCMAAASSAHKRSFGEDTVPGCYEDLELAEVIFVVGSNPAYAHPIIFQRIMKAKELNPQLKIVVIDPRRTATCESADLHLAIKPGSDAYYFNGLLMYLEQEGKLNHAYIDAYCNGFDKALATAKSQLVSVPAAANACDVDEALLIESYQLFASTQKVVTMFSMGINQSSSGVDKGSALINCHLATGAIGQKGAGPFSITGQPNAMGGREVGGLSTQLAAHMNFEDEGAIDKVSRFWAATNIAQKQGLKAVDMFDAVDKGTVKAIWIMATNPVVSMPDAEFVKAALAKCELVVVSECYENTDTVQCADVVFPASTWGEKQGMVTNSERNISLQKGLVNAPDSAKHDWEIIRDVAHAMGFSSAFDYSHTVDIFKEHAALSGFENSGDRLFDISAFSDITTTEYENFTPIQWPVNSKYPNGLKRLFTDGTFVTKNTRAKFVPILAQLPKKRAKKHELVMNTGRIRDQWHTMTRTARTPKLMASIQEPFIHIHPNDALKFNLQDRQLATLSNLGASYLGRANITRDQREGEIFVPIHWNDNFSKSAKASALVNAIVDPVCGQPEFKHSPVTVQPFNAVWSGVIVCVNDLVLNTDYWAKVTINTGLKYFVSGTQALPKGNAFLQALLPDVDDWVFLSDDRQQSSRIAGFVNGKLHCFFMASTDLSETFNGRFIEQQLNLEVDPLRRYRLLAGVDSNGAEDVGEIVCACFQVGENTIKTAISRGECKTIEALGAKLKCGSNCGSCIPELKALL